MGSVGPHVPEMTKCMAQSLYGISVISFSWKLAIAAGYAAADVEVKNPIGRLYYTR